MSQPWRVPLDITEDNEVIEATTRKLVQESATWGPVEDWQAELAVRLEQPAE